MLVGWEVGGGVRGSVAPVSISLKGRWECPLRHLWPKGVPDGGLGSFMKTDTFKT